MPVVNLDSMTKPELADYALTLGITLSTDDTKTQMIEQFTAQNQTAEITPDTTTEPEAPVVVASSSELTDEEKAVAEAEVARLFAEAQARNAEEERIANLPVDEQVELVQWTIEEAIGILRYAVSRGKNKKPFFQEDKINELINKIEESIQY